MPRMQDWRSAKGSATTSLDRQDFAWEFLRRNPTYRADYERIVRSHHDDKPEAANAVANFARHWGLNCTGRPRTLFPRSECTLAAGMSTFNRHTRERTERSDRGVTHRPCHSCQCNRKIGRRRWPPHPII